MHTTYIYIKLIYRTNKGRIFQIIFWIHSHLLVSIQYTERVNEGEVASYCFKLSMRYEAISVVVIVFEYSLKRR